MITLKQVGKSINKKYTAIDRDTDEKIMDAHIKDGDIQFYSKRSHLVFSLRYNDIAMLLKTLGRRGKTFFEIYKQDTLICKVDSLPSHNNLYGFRLETKNLYLQRKNQVSFIVFNEERDIECIIDRTKGRNYSYNIYFYDDTDRNLFIIFAVLIDSLFYKEVFNHYKLNHTCNFVNQNPKLPKIGAYRKVRKDLCLE